jgi:hypothetical protein
LASTSISVCTEIIIISHIALSHITIIISKHVCQG